eukprot:SAG22_NODE_3217_length_1851_cov_1.808219_1_plen_236_part_00
MPPPAALYMYACLAAAAALSRSSLLHAAGTPAGPAGPALPLAAAPRPVSGRNFLGYNVVNLQSGNFSSDPAYAAATGPVAGGLHAGSLRYPGGNLADWWDWRSGWCVANTSVPAVPAVRNPCYAGRSGGRPKPRRVYMLEEFKLALDASGAAPVMMVNMLTSDLSEQLAFLRHARAIGALPPGAYVRARPGTPKRYPSARDVCALQHVCTLRFRRTKLSAQRTLELRDQWLELMT